LAEVADACSGRGSATTLFRLTLGLYGSLKSDFDNVISTAAGIATETDRLSQLIRHQI
jgi:hypothetical protein